MLAIKSLDESSKGYPAQIHYFYITCSFTDVRKWQQIGGY